MPTGPAGGARPSNGPSGPARHRPRAWLIVVALVSMPATAVADHLIALTFQSVGEGVPLTGAGTATASMNFGTVSAFGASLPAGVSRTRTATDYTLSTAFGVRVVKTVEVLNPTPNYTLRARLQAASPLTWRLGETAMTTTYTTVATAQPYASTISHSLSFVVPFTRAAGSVQAVFDVMAIAN